MSIRCWSCAGEPALAEFEPASQNTDGQAFLAINPVHCHQPLELGEQRCIDGGLVRAGGDYFGGDGRRLDDLADLEAECQRITNGAEFFYSMERNGDRYEHIVRFAENTTLREWLRRTHFDQRPMPKFGPTAQEQAAFERSALAWGFRTGAVRRVIQAFRHERGSLTRPWWAAHQMLARYQMPESAGHDVAKVFIAWPQKHHMHWFYGWRQRADDPFRPADWFPPADAYTHSED